MYIIVLICRPKLIEKFFFKFWKNKTVKKYLFGLNSKKTSTKLKYFVFFYLYWIILFLNSITCIYPSLYSVWFWSLSWLVDICTVLKMLFNTFIIIYFIKIIFYWNCKNFLNAYIKHIQNEMFVHNSLDSHMKH